MKKEEIARGTENSDKVDSVAHVENKIFPITEERNKPCGSSENRDQNKGNKKKALSRMKELLRWVASVKTEEGGKLDGRKVLRFRTGGALKAVKDEKEGGGSMNESPKISFRWEVESCSTTCSSFSAVSSVASSRDGQLIPSSISIQHHEEADPLVYRRRGNWITTDSEFVVLEL